MTQTGVSIVKMPPDPNLRHVAAGWSHATWSDLFPGDTPQTYLDLYASADEHAGLPVVLAAIRGDRIVGTASLVADDELPGADEPGPWVAAVFVDAHFRHRGIGEMLVRESVRRAHELGYQQVFLYTEGGVAWYVRLGWEERRQADLRGRTVTVLSCQTG